MPSCFIKCCKKQHKTADTKYFRLPKEEVFLQQWLNILQINFNKIKPHNVYICSRHFETRYLKRDLQRELLHLTKPRNVRTLTEDAIPTLFLDASEENINPVINNKKKETEIENHEKNLSVLKESNRNGNSQLSALEDRIKLLEETVEKTKYLEKKLEETQSELNKKDQQLEDATKKTIPINILKQTLTEGQIRAYMNPNKRVKWAENDIAMAISLKTVSPKAYNYLRKKRNLPLPATSTLRRWVSSLNIKPGLIYSSTRTYQRRVGIITGFGKKRSNGPYK